MPRKEKPAAMTKPDWLGNFHSNDLAEALEKNFDTFSDWERKIQQASDDILNTEQFLRANPVPRMHFLRLPHTGGEEYEGRIAWCPTRRPEEQTSSDRLVRREFRLCWQQPDHHAGGSLVTPLIEAPGYVRMIAAPLLPQFIQELAMKVGGDTTETPQETIRRLENKVQSQRQALNNIYAYLAKLDIGGAWSTVVSATGGRR